MIRYYVWNLTKEDYELSWSNTILFKTLKGAKNLVAQLKKQPHLTKYNYEVRQIDLTTGVKVND